MATHRIIPQPGQDPGEALARAIELLQRQGHTLVQVIELPQELPRAAHWLVVTQKPLEKRG